MLPREVLSTSDLLLIEMNGLLWELSSVGQNVAFGCSGACFIFKKKHLWMVLKCGRDIEHHISGFKQIANSYCLGGGAGRCERFISLLWGSRNLSAPVASLFGDHQGAGDAL